MANLSEKQHNLLEKDVEILDDIRYLNRQQVYIFTPGVNIQKDIEDMDYQLAYLTAMSKSDNENSTPLVDKLLSSSTRVETRQESPHEPHQKKAGGLKGFLGIG